MSRLADLPAAMRADEIRRLKAELRARRRSETTRLLSFKNTDTAVALASRLAIFVYPLVAGLAGTGRRPAELARRSPAPDKMLDALSEDATALRGSKHHCIRKLPIVDQIKVFYSTRHSIGREGRLT